MKDQKKKQIRWQLQVIFLYYTSFGDRNNYKYLKQQNFRRFLIDSQTVKNQSQFPYYDMAFIKIDKSSMLFQQFLQVIPNIAQILYKNVTRKEAFQSYISKYIKSLYQEIISKSDFGEALKIITKSQIQYKTIHLLEKLFIVRKMYEKYILSTSMHQKLPIDTFERIHLCLKQFEVCPQLVSVSMSYVCFSYFILVKQAANKFTQQDFIQLIIRLAEIGNKKSITDEGSQIGKVIRMLQRMQISVGFQQLSKQLTRETSAHITFFTPQIRSYYLKQSLVGIGISQGINKLWPSSTRHKNCQSFDFHNSSRQKQYQTNQTNIKDQSIITAIQMKQIKKLFDQLCSYGQVANSKTLKSMKIKKLFKKIGILNVLGQTWVDLRISNLVKHTTSGKIQFPQFLQLLDLTAKQLTMSLQQLIKLTLQYQNKDSFKSIERNSKIQQIVNIHQVKQILKCVEKQINKIFIKYSDNADLMNFQQTMKLMYDFEIFPQIISKSKLYLIFEENSDYRKSQEDNFSLTQQAMINFQGFENLLVGTALSINQQSITQCQKLIILFQKMNESKGQKSNIRSAVSLVYELRIKFSNLYQNTFKKNNKNKTQNFDQLIDSIHL